MPFFKRRHHQETQATPTDYSRYSDDRLWREKSAFDRGSGFHPSLNAEIERRRILSREAEMRDHAVDLETERLVAQRDGEYYRAQRDGGVAFQTQAEVQPMHPQQNFGQPSFGMGPQPAQYGFQDPVQAAYEAGYRAGQQQFPPRGWW